MFCRAQESQCLILTRPLHRATAVERVHDAPRLAWPRSPFSPCPRILVASRLVRTPRGLSSPLPSPDGCAPAPDRQTGGSDTKRPGRFSRCRPRSDDPDVFRFHAVQFVAEPVNRQSVAAICACSTPLSANSFGVFAAASPLLILHCE